jgi:hypothetical protein
MGVGRLRDTERVALLPGPGVDRDFDRPAAGFLFDVAWVFFAAALLFFSATAA